MTYASTLITVGLKLTRKKTFHALGRSPLGILVGTWRQPVPSLLTSDPHGKAVALQSYYSLQSVRGSHRITGKTYRIRISSTVFHKNYFICDTICLRPIACHLKVTLYLRGKQYEKKYKVFYFNWNQKWVNRLYPK